MVDAHGTKPDDVLKWYRYWKRRETEAKKKLAQLLGNLAEGADYQERRATLEEEMAYARKELRAFKERVSAGPD
jgi:hypothetical protein